MKKMKQLKLMKQMKKETKTTQEAKHSMLTSKEIRGKNIKYILAALAMLSAIVMLLFGESKLIYTANQTTSVNFNKLYYLNTTTGERFLTLSEAVTDAIRLENGGGETTYTIKAINSRTEDQGITIPSDKAIVLDLNGKTITFSGSGITNAGDLTVTDSTIVEANTNATGKIVAASGTPITSTGTLTIGTNDSGTNGAIVSATAPQIQGTTYGISSTGTFNFYDGKIIGPTGQAISVDPDELPEGFKLVSGTEQIDGVTYQTASLDNHYTITFDANGGTMNNSTSTTTYTQTYGSKIIMNNPTREGYEFMGWVSSERENVTTAGYWTYEDSVDPLTGENLEIINEYDHRLNGYAGGTAYTNTPTTVSGAYTPGNVATATTSTVNYSSEDPNPLSINATSFYRLTRTSYTDASYSCGPKLLMPFIHKDVNQVYVMVARFPENWTLDFNPNAGSGGGKWLTSRTGTGEWETYVFAIKVKENGQYQNGGFFSIINNDTNTNTINPTMDVAYLQGYYTNKQSATANVNKFKLGACDETLTAKWQAVNQNVAITLNDNNSTYKVTASNLFDKTDMIINNSKIIQTNPAWYGASTNSTDSTHFISGLIKVYQGATYRITGVSEDGLVEWFNSGKNVSLYNEWTQATTYTNNTDFTVPTTYTSYTDSSTHSVTYTFMRFQAKTSDINNIALEMVDSPTYTTNKTLIFPNNATVTVTSTPSTGYSSTITKTSGLGTLTTATVGTETAGTLLNIAGAATTTNLSISNALNTYTLTLDNQTATTPGTTAAYYLYGTATYYSDLARTTQLTNNKITVPTKTGYVFKGYYTEANGGGTKYIDETGAFINNAHTAISENTTLYAYWVLDMAGAQINDINIYDVDTRQIQIQNASNVENVASYASSDTSVATVSNAGLITAQGEGTATITMTGDSGATKTVTTTVKPSYSTTKNVNVPKLTDGMIPIKWDSTANSGNGSWVVCSEDDASWYNYTSADKLWANVMLSDGTYKAGTVSTGTEVAESDLGSMYVWIPRFAYQMPANATTTKGTIDVTFLKKNTNEENVEINPETYIKPTDSTNTETTKVVHPAFTLGGKELTGFWMAKFEMSGKNSSGQYVGNASATGNNGTYDPVAYQAGFTIAKSLPNVPSWRDITIGESEYQSMLIAGDNKASYGLDNATSHLIRNSEWGAVAYLCYSNYGTVPQINGCGSYVTNNSSWYYDMYTGQGPASDGNTSRYAFNASTTIADCGYSTTKGKLASTTGNITGVYDMNGGSWERVAAYLDNGNGNLNSYGKSSTNSSVQYFKNGVLQTAYENLWEAYEVSSEEKNNAISVTIDGVTSTISQSSLWQASKTAQTYIEARKRLTDANYNNMAKHKGIGVNEVSTECSFYTTFDYKSKIAGTDPAEYETKNTWNWFKSVATAMSRANGTSTAAEYATSWDGDYVLIGHASNPFVMRGGNCNTGAGAGVFSTHITTGNVSYNNGFRAVLVP